MSISYRLWKLRFLSEVIEEMFDRFERFGETMLSFNSVFVSGAVYIKIYCDSSFGIICNVMCNFYGTCVMLLCVGDGFLGIVCYCKFQVRLMVILPTSQPPSSSNWIQQQNVGRLM